MTREHKAGLAVTCSFLGLVGSVVWLKLREPQPGSAAPDPVALNIVHNGGLETKPEDPAARGAKKDGKGDPKKPPQTAGSPPAGPQAGKGTTGPHPPSPGTLSGTGFSGADGLPNPDPNVLGKKPDPPPAPGQEPLVKTGKPTLPQPPPIDAGPSSLPGFAFDAPKPSSPAPTSPPEHPDGKLAENKGEGEKKPHHPEGKAGDPNEKAAAGSGGPRTEPVPVGLPPAAGAGPPAVDVPPLGKKPDPLLPPGQEPKGTAVKPAAPPAPAPGAQLPDPPGMPLGDAPVTSAVPAIPPDHKEGQSSEIKEKDGEKKPHHPGGKAGDPIEKAAAGPGDPRTEPVPVGLPPSVGAGPPAVDIPPPSKLDVGGAAPLTGGPTGGEPRPQGHPGEPAPGARSEPSAALLVPPPGSPTAGASASGASSPAGKPEESLFIPDPGKARSPTASGTTPASGMAVGAAAPTSGAPAGTGTPPHVLGAAFAEVPEASAGRPTPLVPMPVEITDPAATARGAGPAPGPGQTAPLPAGPMTSLPVSVPSGSSPTVASPEVLPPTPIVASSPPARPVVPTAAAAGSIQPVEYSRSWGEETYTCQPGDTFQTISKGKYGSDTYAQALQQYNRNHPQTSDAVHQTGVLKPGEVVFIPDIQFFEWKYGVPASKPAAGGPSR